MKSILISIPSNHPAESSHPTVAPDPSTDFPLPKLPTVYQPNWLLALMLLTILANRLYQVLVVILYLLREWKQKNNPDIK